MKIGLNLWIWDSPFDSGKHLNLFDKVRASGGEVIEFGLEEDAIVEVNRVRQALRDNNLACSLVGLYGPPRDLSLDGPTQRAGLDYTKRAIDLCAEIGADLLTGAVMGVGGTELISESARRARFERCAAALRHIGDWAQAAGIRFAVEILNRYETNLLNTAAEALELMRQVDHASVGVHLDSFHMSLEENRLDEAIRLVGSKLLHFHGSDSHRGTPGDALVRWDQVADGLAAIHYDGYVVIESFNYRSPLGPLAKAWRPYASSPDDLAQRGLTFLRDMLLTGNVAGGAR